MSLLDILIKGKGRAVASIQKRGLGGTVRLIPAFLSATIRGDPEKRFDRRFQVDTAGILKPVELQSDPRFKDSNWYAPTSTRRFFRMLRQFNVDFRKFVFIDFGCGKGKALLLASQLPFKEIIGIELWSDLISVAEKNLKTYTGKRRCNAFRLHCVHANEFKFPEERGIYYFFDPFREEVMLQVLENMRRSLAATHREAYVLYCEPSRPDLLDKSDFLMLVKQTPHYSIYKALTTFSEESKVPDAESSEP